MGRVYISGNSGTHLVKLVQVSTSGVTDVPGGSVSIAVATGTVGQFTYTNLPSPVTLAANTAYYLVSQESAGGDYFYDVSAVTDGNSGASILGPVYNKGSYVFVDSSANYSYVPVNLLYTISGGKHQYWQTGSFRTKTAL